MLVSFHLAAPQPQEPRVLALEQPLHLVETLRNVTALSPSGRLLDFRSLLLMSLSPQRADPWMLSPPRPVARPLVLGQGEMDSTQYETRDECLAACSVTKPSREAATSFGSSNDVTENACGSHACLCFECRLDRFKSCRRCYGMPPNCGDPDTGKYTHTWRHQCHANSEPSSWRGTLEKGGCCEVTGGGGTGGWQSTNNHALDVAVLNTWRPLVGLTDVVKNTAQPNQ